MRTDILFRFLLPAYAHRQNDMLQWILEGAIPRNYSDIQIIERIMLVNFAAIHTSSNVSVKRSYIHAMLM